MKTVQTRQEFLKAVGCGLAAAVMPLGAFALASSSGPKNVVRILPLRDGTYSPSFLAFCQTARFESIQHALLSVRDREIEFDLEFVPES